MATLREDVSGRSVVLGSGVGSLAFDYAVLAAALWFIGGLLVDGWAHNHLDLRAEGFFTPYHALFYAGFVAVAAVVLAGTWRNRRNAASLRAAIPSGYGSTLAGLAIFAVGGALDLMWHIAFGVEQDLEALFSPTHLLLAVGIGAILCGPIRAVARRAPARAWREQLPALAALALFATLVLFFFMWAYSLAAGRAGDPHLANPALPARSLALMIEYQMGHGITAIVVRSIVLAGIALWAARRFDVPFGAIPLLVTVPSVLVGAMLDPSPHFLFLQLCASLVAGLACDIALSRYGVLGRGAWGGRAVGFGAPFLFWATYLALANVQSGGFWWTAHVVYGAPVIGGLVGLLLAILMEPRTEPAS